MLSFPYSAAPIEKKQNHFNGCQIARLYREKELLRSIFIYVHIFALTRKLFISIESCA